MHIVALVSGILSLIVLPLLAVVRSPLPLFASVALGVVALITGAMSRPQRAGKAGIVLGLVGSVGTLVLVFLFMGRTVSVSGPPAVSSPPATTLQ